MFKIFKPISILIILTLTLSLGGMLPLFSVPTEVSARSGGPDDYGYSFIDNYEPGGPAYDWKDIVDPGNDTGLDDDDQSDVFPIGFDFDFYGNTYTSVYISSNGFLTFHFDGSTHCTNDCMPDTDDPNDAIYPYWDDLDLRGGGRVYYETQGTSPNRQFIVEWHDVQHYRYDSYPDPVTFEVILYEGSNEILFQYYDVYFDYGSYDYGASATVGIENEDGSIYLQYSCDEYDAITDGLAILFYVLPPPSEVWVDDSWHSQSDVDYWDPSLIWGYNAFNQIQDGIDAVSASTVHVAPGIYYEHITLKDGVKVLGAGANVTTIDGYESGTVVTAISVGPTTELSGFTITNGSADWGGGMYNDNSSPVVSNCVFYDNEAGYGGGMSNNFSSDPTVTNCTFYSNPAINEGGGMCNLFSSPTVTNCIFSGNPTINGGGMSNYDSSPVVTSCIFYGNPADGGGGMYNNNYSDSTVTNCTFYGNTAINEGGGMSNYNSSPTVTNCIFSTNTASHGGAISAGGTSSPTIDYNDVWNNTPDDYYGCGPGANDIFQDPLFVDPGADDYHLQETSPCINMGDNSAPSLPSTDFEGQPRIWNGVVDIGADEYMPSVSEVWVDDDYYDGGFNDGHTWGYDAFDNIQDGVDAVTGSTVYVAAGTYDGGVIINKSLNLVGEGRSVVTVDSYWWYNYGFEVYADSVNISGFFITQGYWGGIYLSGVQNCSIFDSQLYDNWYGIEVYYSSQNTISDNIIDYNWWIGIYLYESNDNTIENNYIYYNCLAWSSPYVYSWDGQEYQLDAQMLTNTPKQEREGTDYDNLELLSPVDGEYLLKLTEEMDEITYFNELKLIVVDHPSGTQIITDREGNIHTIQSPYTPIAAKEFNGTDCLDKVEAADDIFWTSNLENKNFNNDKDLRDGIILTFDKPPGAENAKVVVRFQHTELMHFIGGHFGKLPLDDSEQCRRLRAQLQLLHLNVWNGAEWVHVGPFTRHSTVTAKEDIMFIDLSGIPGNKLKIRLGALTGLVLIDSVVVDYTEDEAVATTDLIDGVTKCTDGICLTELSATTAVDADGADVAPLILSDDDDYLALEKGDYAYLSFDEVAANPGYDRSYVVKTKGYFESPVQPVAGAIPQERLEQFLADFPGTMRYFLERYSPSDHCGIYLDYSDGNTISGNDVYYHYGDGIYLYVSENNQIIDNDVHYSDEDGIDLEYSGNNQIIDNRVYDNGDDGIDLYYSDNVTITNNRAYSNYWSGIYVGYSNYCQISYNVVHDNDWGGGIYLYESYYNIITNNDVYENWYSCPFVYSWDGQEYRLDSMVFNTSASQERESADYDNLGYLTPVDGKYLLKIAEEFFETSYLNELKLIVVDHPSGTQILTDGLGNIYTLRAPYAPIAAEEEDGTDCFDKVKATDGIYWTSNLDNKDFSQEEDLRDGIILTFEKPADAEIAKIAVHFQDTKLAEKITAIVAGLPGCPVWQRHPLIVFLHHLHLEVWNGTEWVYEGEFFPVPGAWVERDMIKLIDVSGIEGDTIRIKLESLTGAVLIDSVVVDYTEDEAVITNELSATTAVDADGVDVAPLILSADEDYLVMEQGDYAYLSFDEVEATPGYDRSYIVKAQGYYESPLMAPAEGEAPGTLLADFMSNFSYAARYFLERYASPDNHCGIVLEYSDNNTISDNDIYESFDDGIYFYYSDNNTISGNEIADNSSEGIYLEYSDWNRIIGNDILCNKKDGISLDNSDNTEILCNNIFDNLGPKSGVHLSGDCSGTVIHYNNIAGNVPYGVWNDVKGATVVDATNNWWGDASGPYHATTNSGGLGDWVSDYVDYAPWLTLPCQAPREANFSAQPIAGEAPLTVQFTDLSIGDIDLWLWFFGDGQSSRERNPVHIYNEPGLYTVSLTVSVDTPCGSLTDTMVKIEYIEVFTLVEPARLIVTNLQIQPAQAYAGEPVTITADVINQGGTRGSKNIELVINGQAEQSTRVGVDPGAAKHITFFISKTVPGTYEVFIEGEATAFNVLLRPHVTSTGVFGDLGTGAIIAIVVVCVIFLVGIIIVFIRVRRRA